MQRTLIMMRHAKTNVVAPGQLDFDRTLTNRGHRNTAEMAERLKEQHLIPGLIIASPAKRTQQTAEGMAEVLGYDKEKIKWVKKLYHCSIPVFEEVIYEIADAVKTVLIIAHNPGISDFVNELSHSFSAGDIPTGAIVTARFDAQHWNDFAHARKEVFLYTYPKKEL